MYKTLIFLFIIIISSQTRLIGQQKNTYIKAGFLYESKSNTLLKNKLIQIQGTKIISISEFESLPKNSDFIDLTKYTVLPGLIDAHTHVFFSQEANEDFAERSIQSLTMESDALRALRAAKRAKSYLEAGITSIKDLGNSGLYLDVALRDAINEGTIDGPRIFASGPILAANGGQVYGVLPKHQNIIDLEYRIITSPEDAKNAVREHVNQNVDLIKICADNIPNNTYLTIDEIKSIVETAHSYNLKVTAHSVTNQSAWNAIEAGVDGIEHGFNLADSTLVKMAEKQIFLVPTENSKSYMYTYAKLADYKENELDWIDGYAERMKKRLDRAIEKGVPIVAGSDNYTNINVTRGKSSKDMFKYYLEAGMQPLDILQSCTYISAFHLGRENEIGDIKPKANADIIAVKGDIINDFISTIENVVFIMKDGKIYKNKTN
ncbi:amidohydrolase family protein [Psychroserpens burtonensis]|jgi:imidazolonepropionase-like amidohydrolase|uniref:Amidohydrolase family protein n=1 Tax=Psychroserpens burtonensis TaxID=49278 RepID=A0A5C7B2E9_9FLAO|nr:amidohydrolase family protein [Psychroserpens burtonensis]TXE15352.1 amidohydrolase family protein [Psychroserpens burtonensis]